MDLRNMVRTTSYTEQAREVIKHLIFNGTYQPGERLKEGDLSRALGISRGPVREAIQSLANEGLVKLAPQRGAFVSTFDLEEIRELYEVREALEGLAARLAAEKSVDEDIEGLFEFLKATGHALENDSALYPRDLDFHQQICRLAGNGKLLDHVSQIHAQLQLARSRSSSKPGRARRAYEEHLKIYEAIKSRDLEEAERAMKAHLRSGLGSTLEIMDRSETGAA
jgi:DNA-binding GntR family transcriptional regulator